MTRAVFDSTVLISAFLRPGGVSDELLALAASAEFALVLSEDILKEATGKLLGALRIRRRYRYEDSDVEAFRRNLRDLAEVVGETPTIVGAVRDPNDDMILGCALAGRANYVITRDDDLLSLGRWRQAEIISPEQFRMRLREGRAG